MPKTVYRSKSSSKPTARSYGSYKDRNLAAMSPEAAQEATKPTPAEPVQMQKRLAGCA
jgi:hypothetical protein